MVVGRRPKRLAKKPRQKNMSLSTLHPFIRVRKGLKAAMKARLCTAASHHQSYDVPA